MINSSPLILLARIGCAHWLEALPDEAVIPASVAAEISAGPSGDAARSFLGQTSIATVAEPVPPADLLAEGLGRGETGVIAVCLYRPGWRAVLDDRVARRQAQSRLITVCGTLGVVRLARLRGLIANARSVVVDLRANGFYVSDRLLDRALAEFGD